MEKFLEPFYAKIQSLRDNTIGAFKYVLIAPKEKTDSQYSFDQAKQHIIHYCDQHHVIVFWEGTQDKDNEYSETFWCSYYKYVPEIIQYANSLDDSFVKKWILGKLQGWSDRRLAHFVYRPGPAPVCILK